MKALKDMHNGFLKSAKRSAKAIPYLRIVRVAMEDYCYGLEEAHSVASFLKGHISHDRMCQEMRAMVVT